MSWEAAIACSRAEKDAENSLTSVARDAVCRAIASTRVIEFLMRCFISCSIRSFSSRLFSVVSCSCEAAS